LCRASIGETSRSMASISSEVSAPASTKNTLATLSSSRPLFSSAAIVLSKLGAAGFAAMTWLDRREGRQLEGAGPGGKQRILDFGGGWRIVHSLHVVADRVSWRGPSRPHNVGTTRQSSPHLCHNLAGRRLEKAADDTPRRPRKDIRIAGAVEQRSSEPRSPGCRLALTFGANFDAAAEQDRR